MNIEALLTSADFLQSSIIFITLTANVPQWITINRNKTSANISLSSWVMWLIASCFALYYAVVNQCAYQTCLALMLTTSVSFLCNLFTIFLILKFRTPQNMSYSSLEVVDAYAAW